MKKLNISDVKKVAVKTKDVTKDAVKSGSKKVADKVSKAKYEYDIKRFRPIFMEELDSQDYEFPNIIYIESENEHDKEEVCKGAVGYNRSVGNYKAISLLKEHAQHFGLEYFPNLQEGLYYVDPLNINRYINLNEYFILTQKEKVNELTELAHSLGATYFKVSIKEESKKFVSHKKKSKGGIKQGGFDSERKEENKQYENIEVLSETRFKGQEPKVPSLKYFADDKKIQSLINMRMDPESPVTEETLVFRYNNSSGITSSEAEKIDMLIKKLKLTGNRSIANQVQDENRTYFEYKIEFPKE